MKVLLRYCNNAQYQWINAEWENGKYYELHERGRGYQFNQSNIMAVTEDDRTNYVRCAHCGKLIQNTPEAIEEHFAKQEADKNCINCKYLRIYGNKRNVVTKYDENEDGTYTVTETCNATLGCGKCYWTSPVDSDEAKNRCIYNQCRKIGVKPIEDVFVKYPNLFSRQITVDALNANKYAYEEYRDGYFIYDMKCRGCLKACVNSSGIVDKFLVIIRGWETDAYYSATHNMLLFINGGKYDENWRDYISETRHNDILKKLSKLYEEVNA